MDIQQRIVEISEEGELWKPCPEFEEKYLVSSHGRVMSIGTYNTCKKGELIKLHKKHGRNGYIQARFYDNGRAKTFEIHLLVAKAFIPNPNNLPMVNHIDEDKTNNRVENLEWCTNQYNVKYSSAKAVDVYTKDGEFVETLEAISEAAVKYNTDTTNISRCCKSQYGTCNGYQFRYSGESFQKKPISKKQQRRKERKGHDSNENRYIPINVYSTTGQFLKTYNSLSQAASACGTTTGNICKCYKGKLLTNKGYIFLLDTNIDARLLQLSNRKHKSKSEKNMSYNESLSPNSNYPAMSQSQWDSAPFNDPIIPEKEFDVTCCQVLSKTVSVSTSNYIPGASGVDYEYDPEGSVAVGWQDPDDTSDTNWEEEYHNNDYHTPLQLIELFGQFLKQQLEHGVVFKSPRFTQSLIDECKDWIEDETEYNEES